MPDRERGEPLRRESVTHVSDINRHLCDRNRHIENGSPGRLRLSMSLQLLTR
jgi:hypothetical protein